jgi:hypothetical protein
MAASGRPFLFPDPAKTKSLQKAAFAPLFAGFTLASGKQLLTCSGVLGIQYLFAQVLRQVFQILHSLTNATAGGIVTGSEFLNVGFDFSYCLFDGFKDFAHNMKV